MTDCDIDSAKKSATMLSCMRALIDALVEDDPEVAKEVVHLTGRINMSAKVMLAVPAMFEKVEALSKRPPAIVASAASSSGADAWPPVVEAGGAGRV
jgi:hypothetical protein